jgi:hypothetical protein
MTVVYNGTSDLTSAASTGYQNSRLVFTSGSLSSAAGTQVRLTFIFSGTGDGGYSIGTVYFGKMGATEPDFDGTQVQILFGGNPTFSSLATAGAVTSDWATLPAAYSNGTVYVAAWYVPFVPGNLGTYFGFYGNVDYWRETTSHADSSSSTIPSTALSESGAGQIFMLSELEIQASAPSYFGLPRRNIIRPARRIGWSN